MIQRLYLLAKEIAGNRIISVLVLLSVIVSVFSVGIFRIVGDTLTEYVNRRFAAAIPPNTMKISTRQPRSAFIFDLQERRSPVISERQLARIRAMEGITEILPVMALNIPLQARITYLGFNYRSDLLAFGVPYRMVRDDIPNEKHRRLWREPDLGGEVPVLVPRSILMSYNDGMAAANGLPRLSERGALGFGFRLLLGWSSLKALKGNREANGVIAGFTDRVDSLALILPLKLAAALNREFNESYRNEYQYAYVRVRDHASLLRTAPLIKKMGLVVEAEKSVSLQIMKLRDAIGLIVAALQFIILAISVIAISFATVIATLNRIEYYRTLRVIGASRLFLTGMVLIKYALVGLAGAWAGTTVLRYAAGAFARYFHLAGIMISLSFPPEAARFVRIYGMAIPVVSTVPALVRLYFKGLSRD